MKQEENISTHALTEGDGCAVIYCHHHSISTHALTEGDPLKQEDPVQNISFQLTPSRRATNLDKEKAEDDAFQLTPSRRATLSERDLKNLLRISTHALTEGD